MSPLIRYFLGLVSLLTLIHCATDTNPLQGIDDHDNLCRDSTKVYVKEGIFIELSALKSVYSLNDTISGDLYLINENNDEGLEIYISNWPPSGGYQVFDEHDQSVYFNVWATGCAVFHRFLMPGDTLHEPIFWTQQTATSQDYYSRLKLFSGHYRLQGFFWGSEAMWGKYALKCFHITEEGEPLSTKAHRHYEVDDSIKVSFLVRNRVSGSQQFTLNALKEIEIHYIRDGQTILNQFDYLDLPDSTLNFDPHSDRTLYTYSIAKNDSLLSGLDGRYDLTLILRCRERTIQASVATYIF
jgi:hypothetical protein